MAGTWLGFAVCFLTLGCGGGASGDVDGATAGDAASGAASRFVGTWAYATGTTTRSCPGQPDTLAPPEGTLALALGTAQGTLVVTEPGACALDFTLQGSTATSKSGQTCAGPDGAGGQIKFTKMTWTLTLSSDGATLTEALSADEQLIPASGPSRACKYSETGVTLRRP
jgi:hypothetical protein